MAEVASVSVGFASSRNDTLAAIYKMGARCCSYSMDDCWVDRCDCKYGLEKWPTISEQGNGCPELRSLYVVVAAMTDAEWAALLDRTKDKP